MIERIAAALEERARSRKQPLAARTTSWLSLVSICWETDDQVHRTQDVTQADMAIHREIFSRAISSGEELVGEWGSDVRVIGVDRLKMESTLQSLRIKFTKWHGNRAETGASSSAA